MKSLIIPSAGFAKRLYPLSQNTPKVLIKLNGVPLFHLMYLKARELKMDNIIIIINPEFKRQLKEFIKDTYKNANIPIHIVEVEDKTAGVLYSVYCGTSSKYCHKHALIMLSDTIYRANMPDIEKESFVYYEEVEKPYKRWCLVSTDKLGKVKKFWDKPKIEPDTNKALIGIYNVKAPLFNKCCKKVFKKGIKHRGEYQLSQALNMYKNNIELFAIKAQPGAWKDTGTLHNLKLTSIDFFLTRNFNKLSVDKGILKKKSKNIKALKNEYMWYKTINIRHLTPAIYNLQDFSNSAELSMEFCSLVDLGTIFNFCKARPVFFEQVISYILETMDKYFYSKKGTIDKDSNFQMFVQKLQNRAIDKVKKNKYYSKLLKELKAICKTKTMPIIHGDLNLSNILFEPQRMIIKLIDPRGEYGNLNIYGDLRYDLAKLLHSLDGKYETIVHNLYKIKNGKIIFYMNKDKQRCFKSAEEALYSFAKKKGITKRELKLIEASLYWSMIPLHNDKKRQKAFYIIGQNICEEIFNG